MLKHLFRERIILDDFGWFLSLIYALFWRTFYKPKYYLHYLVNSAMVFQNWLIQGIGNDNDNEEEKTFPGTALCGRMSDEHGLPLWQSPMLLTSAFAASRDHNPKTQDSGDYNPRIAELNIP